MRLGGSGFETLDPAALAFAIPDLKVFRRAGRFVAEVTSDFVVVPSYPEVNEGVA